MSEKIDILSAAPVEVKDPLVFSLSRPAEFEGKSYSEINLRALNDWTCDDLVKVTKAYNQATGGSANPMDVILPEANLEYVEFVAAKATGLPLEFFKGLPAREAGKLRTAVIAFFHPAD